MDPLTFTSPELGRLVDAVDALGRRGKAFLPAPLPPVAQVASRSIRVLNSEADRALARLDGMAAQIEHPEILFRNYLRREAQLSSAIEGTHTTLADLALFEVSGAERAGDESEVEGYIRALQFGLSAVEHEPISPRLITQTHAMLMPARRSDATPGRLRDCLVFIGEAATFADARFVPPPEIFVSELLDDLCRFLLDVQETPLIKIAIAHYQFETIHPFRDGNGRIGRLLISLWLQRERILLKPMLYPSAYFAQHRQAYYDALLGVSQSGAWEAWIAFFLRAVAEQADDAVQRARALSALRRAYGERLRGPRVPLGLASLVDHLFETLVVSVPDAARILGVTYPAARRQLDRLIDTGILAAEPISVGGTKYYFARELIRTIDGPLAEVSVRE
jgi:Fic family protein